MANTAENITELIICRARELAHLHAIAHEWTSIIETRRQLEIIRRVPQRKKQSTNFEHMREMAMNEASLIERKELPSLVRLLAKAICNHE